MCSFSRVLYLHGCELRIYKVLLNRLIRPLPSTPPPLAPRPPSILALPKSHPRPQLDSVCAAQSQPFPHPQGTSAHYFLEGGIFQHRLIVAQGKEEHSALTVGVMIGHDVGLVAAGVIGVHEVVRAAWIVLEVVQFVGHGKVFEAGGNRMIGVGDGDGEIHVRAVAVRRSR